MTANKDEAPGSRSDQSVRETATAAIPAKIINGLCPWCKGDLSFLFPSIESGEIDPPEYCPICGKPVLDEIEVEILFCKCCETEIVDSQKEHYCRKCGKRINYETAAAGGG